MNVRKQILYLYAETPMHVGTGVGLGAVDMPIQREKHTGYPVVQASGVKGALRDTAELQWRDSDEGNALINTIFGSDSNGSNITHAGAMSPSDARILLFPVRALNGVFVWITSPTVLERFKRETGASGDLEVPEIAENGTALVSSEALHNNRQIMIEEFTYSAEVSPLARDWADYFAREALPAANDNFWKDRLRSHFVILSDNEFRDFVRYSTDIVTRIHIDDVKKTVKDGQLFTQELLPADSLMYSFVHITDSRDGRIDAQEVISNLQKAIGSRIQIGGDETVGRGRVQLNWQGVQ